MNGVPRKVRIQSKLTMNISILCNPKLRVLQKPRGTAQLIYYFTGESKNSKVEKARKYLDSNVEEGDIVEFEGLQK